MKNIFVLFLTIFFTFTAVAQTPKAYVRSGTFWVPERIIVNNKELKLSFWAGYDDLEDEVKSNPKAALYAGKHICYAAWGSGFLWGGLAGALAYAGTAPRDTYRTDTYLLIFLSGFLPAVIFQQASRNNMLRAINIYNGVPEESAKMNFDILPVKDGGVFALSTSF